MKEVEATKSMKKHLARLVMTQRWRALVPMVSLPQGLRMRMMTTFLMLRSVIQLPGEEEQNGDVAGKARKVHP